MVQQGQGKLRWGELGEDDGEDLNLLLPLRQVTDPDENDIKKAIEYKFDDNCYKKSIHCSAVAFSVEVVGGKARSRRPDSYFATTRLEKHLEAINTSTKTSRR